MAFLADLIFIIQLLVAVSPSSMALKQCKVKTTSKPGFFLVGYAKVMHSWKTGILLQYL